MSQQQALTVAQQKLSDLWDEHVRTEFSAHAPNEAIATMIANPLVNQVPVLSGGFVQLGLIDPAGLPVVGAEGAQYVLDRSIR